MSLLGQMRWKLLLGVFKIKRIFRGWFGTRMLDYSGAKLLVTTQTIREYETRARSVRKEPKTVAWFEKYSRPGAVVYDIGANVGAYALIAASRGAHVVAVEPTHQNLYSLHENILLNGLDERFTVLPLLLGNREGYARFSVRDSSFGASRGFTSGGEKAGKAYLVMTLDRTLELFSLPSPTAIKIDIDGAEVELLEGASRTLGGDELRSVLIETEEANTEAVKVRLQKAGFTLMDETRMDRHTVNYIFERV